MAGFGNVCCALVKAGTLESAAVAVAAETNDRNVRLCMVVRIITERVTDEHRRLNLNHQQIFNEESGCSVEEHIIAYEWVQSQSL